MSKPTFDVTWFADTADIEVGYSFGVLGQDQAAALIAKRAAPAALDAACYALEGRVDELRSFFKQAEKRGVSA